MLRSVTIAMLAVILILARPEVKSFASEPAGDLPPPVWSILRGFVNCLKTQHEMHGASIRVLCGADIAQDELECLQHYKNIRGRKVPAGAFPGRTIYGFQISCSSSGIQNYLGVQIERLERSRWSISVRRPIP